ncbi:MAG: glycoside hydrolase family 13 protein [Oscillospiraceae bacterium]|jgi:glycosidase|nr:glycoside hydrolase family 13 protein [Oscillospiraceae bacterium]
MTIEANKPLKIKVPALRVWDEDTAEEFMEEAEATVKFPHAGLYWVWSGQERHRQVTVYEADYRTPEWIKGGICYHIFVDRFFNPAAVGSDFEPLYEDTTIGSDFYGGTLYGVTEKLGYLAELGVSCIYLSPILDSGSNHKYDTCDYETIDEGFGGAAAFGVLCREAGKLGMRVILDGVFSHCGIGSRYFREHPEWFLYEADGVTPKYWWGVKTLPLFDKTNPEYIEYICGEDGIAKRWLEAGASGWRLDVVDELPDAFLNPLCERIKRTKPDALIIGEVWEDATNKISYGVRRRYFLGGQLDGTTNYPLRSAIIDYLLSADAEALAAYLAEFVGNTPKPALDAMMNVLGTHDTIRIITALSGAELPQTREGFAGFRLTAEQYALARRRLKLASALVFTLPGFPCIYYGDEAGVQGGADPFNRAAFPWGDYDRELGEWYRYLGKMRRENRSALADGELSDIRAEGGVLSFSRGGTLFVTADADALTINISRSGV